MSDIAVNIKNLKKKYDTVEAVKNLSLEVKKGELFGLIGPDGAGKTSSMRIMCGLLSADEGRCSILDFNVEKQIKQIRKIIGYMPQRFSLYPDLTVAENLRFFADLFQVPTSERKKRTDRLLQFSKLGPFQNRRANDLSGGMKQKLALSCTLIHTPQVLILDEPTTGVDPVSRREFWDILHELIDEGVTMLVSTPYMDEAQKCHQVALMHQGEILVIDEPDNLMNYFSHELIEIQSDDLHLTMGELEDFAEILSMDMFGDKIHITVEDAQKMSSKLRNSEISIRSLKKIKPGLEDVFIDLMKK